jgi:hypothetical protein
MGFSCGIVGLPNVGKSTLFNAMTKAGAESSNYPFCTIEPNVGIVDVPDARLTKISGLSKSKKTTPTTVEFVDIAGLVEGASKGEGLGNQFLSNIRNVDAIVQVVRLFEDENIIHIGEVDPLRDLDIINTELMLKDLDTLESTIDKRLRLANSGDKAAKAEAELLSRIREEVSKGVLIKNIDLDDNAKKTIRGYQFLTAKPLLVCANVSEGMLSSYGDNPNYKKLKAYCDEIGADIVVLCAKIEEELSELSVEEAHEYLRELGEEKSGLEKLIMEGYSLLGLITFFTTGEKESRAWTVRRGTKAPQAAGAIHSDMERGFIRAETVSYGDFIAAGSWNTAKEAGKLRLEGKEYIVKDGDIMLFRFSV